MSNKPYKGFEPKWLLTPAPADSYRSIFRWGDPNFFKYPNERDVQNDGRRFQGVFR